MRPSSLALGVVALCALSGSALGDGAKTPLLSEDLTTRKKTKIDAPKGSLDADLDAVLGGPQGFSTQQLEKINDRIRAALQKERPRATPRVIAYLYPGRVTMERLKAMREIFVDVQLVMDPCQRTVCKDAVAHHIELVGRAVEKPELTGPGYRMIFKNLILETSVQMHDAEVEVYQVPIAACLEAGRKKGGGLAWLAGQDKAEKDYEPIVTQAIIARAKARRVPLAGAPSVQRGGGSVDVTVKVNGDRSRVQQQVLDAMAAAAEGLRANPKTPAGTRIEVDVRLAMRGSDVRRFRSPGNPVGLYVDGKLDGKALLASYIEEVKKQAGAQTMAFDDADARGGGGGDGPEPDDSEALAILADNFAALGGCARDEAGRNRSFKGVTVVFKWTPAGAAADVRVKEPALAKGTLAGCLKKAVESIRFPRFSGRARTIEYPIRVK